MKWKSASLATILAAAKERGKIVVTLESPDRAKSFRFALYRHELWSSQFTASLKGCDITVEHTKGVLFVNLATSPLES